MVHPSTGYMISRVLGTAPTVADAIVEQLSAAADRAEDARAPRGPRSEAEAEAFGAQQELRDILRLRTWDEMAKDPEWRGPELPHYREMLARHLAGRRG
jgi:predicted HD phosphohydrolase